MDITTENRPNLMETKARRKAHSNKEATSFFENGYTTIKLDGIQTLLEMRRLLAADCDMEPTLLHEKKEDQETHLLRVKRLSDRMLADGLFYRFAEENISVITENLGFDLDVQRVPHLRVSRPSNESDFIGWHRDTFYGNSPYEYNLWLPIFDLEPGAGLRLLPGSHLVPESNTRTVEETEVFRKTVTKGSVANQLGYLYSPKTDDIVANLDESKTVLLAPKFGEAILFIGTAVHRAQNLGSKTRLTFDTRFKHKDAPTETKVGYYEPLTRSVISRAAEIFMGGTPQ